MPILAILFMGGGVQAQKTKGFNYGQQVGSYFVPRMQGDGSTTQPGGILEVALMALI